MMSPFFPLDCKSTPSSKEISKIVKPFLTRKTSRFYYPFYLVDRWFESRSEDTKNAIGISVTFYALALNIILTCFNPLVGGPIFFLWALAAAGYIQFLRHPTLVTQITRDIPLIRRAEKIIRKNPALGIPLLSSEDLSNWRTVLNECSQRGKELKIALKTEEEVVACLKKAKKLNANAPDALTKEKTATEIAHLENAANEAREFVMDRWSTFKPEWEKWESVVGTYQKIEKNAEWFAKYGEYADKVTELAREEISALPAPKR